MNNDIMITGGLGLIGTHLTRQLLQSGISEKSVHIIDTERNFLPHNLRNEFVTNRMVRRMALIGKCNLYSIDTRHAFEMEDLIRNVKPKTIVHLAALPLANISNEISQEASSTIISSTLNILEIVKRHSPETHIIYASSSMVYGNFSTPVIDETHELEPMSMYGAVKLAGEVLLKSFCKKNDIPFTIVRPSAVYGPTDVNRRVVQAFFDDCRLKNEIQVNGRNSVLDFTYVEDIAKGFRLCCSEEKAKNETFNITSCDPKSLGELANIYKELFPKVEVTYGEHEVGVPVRGGLNNERAKNIIGYFPDFDLNRGLSKYIAEELSW